jgi:hypothetical protein
VAETTARAHGRARGAQIQAPGEVVRVCGRASEDGGRGPRRGGGKAAGRERALPNPSRCRGLWTRRGERR